MASEVFEDVLDLPIALLEALPIPVDARLPGYPLPQLQATGQVDTRTFRAVVLENPYLRLRVVPDLGGRILSVFDKRTERELLPLPQVLTPVPGGARGLTLPVGIQLRLTDEDRPNAMGKVAFQLDPAQDEEESAGVWLAETSHTNGLAAHWHVSLPPDAPSIRIEVRAHNRTFRALPYDARLEVPGTGLAVANGGPRFGDGGWLAPRQADTWTATLIPLDGGGTAANDEATLHLEDALVRAQTTSERTAHKLVLLTESGQTLEAPADLTPDAPLEIPLDGLPSRPMAVALLDPYGVEVLRADRSEKPEAWSPDRPADLDPADARLERLAFDPALRGPAQVALGIRAMAERAWDAADRALEQALLYNGDDPLAWWALTAVRRLRGDEGERPELLNAHYLSPLEPLLRAEAFLGQSPHMGKEPSPLVAPVAEIPEDLIEVACGLIEHGLLDQASRWIDEALRHHDLAMLRYLMASILLRGTRMEAEAAEHVRAAAGARIPPLPWRPAELDALRQVTARFPGDASAVRLLAIAELNQP